MSEGGAFLSLRNRNFRVWSAGALVSNVGVWMQRMAQDWLVLVHLTHHDAAAVGIVVACQFGPQVVLLPWTGSAADQLNRRKLMCITQAFMAILTMGLAILTLGGWVELWHVYLFALLLGCASAFDGPAQQTFIVEMVGEDGLSSAVGLNSTFVNASRLVGPALAGVLISAVGTGWVFVINSFSFLPLLIALARIRPAELHASGRVARKRGSFLEGLRYVRGRLGLVVLLAMVFIFGSLGLNYPIFISTMAASVFHIGARGFGFLTAAMACGSVLGALLAARRQRPTMRIIVIGAVMFGCAYTVAALMPSYVLFGLAMFVVGVTSQTVTTSTASLVQLSTEPRMRGRVMALFMTIALGGQPIGAPLVGWIANGLGPRYAVMVGAMAGFATALIGIAYIRSKSRRENVPEA